MSIFSDLLRILFCGCEESNVESIEPDNVSQIEVEQGFWSWSIKQPPIK